MKHLIKVGSNNAFRFFQTIRTLLREEICNKRGNLWIKRAKASYRMII